MSLTPLLETCQARIEKALQHWLPTANVNPALLHEVMRYSSLDGGKRIRPLLVYLTGQMLDIAPSVLDGPACALELIHVLFADPR